MKKLTPPQEEPIQVAETYSRDITIPQGWTQYRDEAVAAAQKLTMLPYPAPEARQLFADQFGELKAIIKAVEDCEEAARKPVNAWLKTVRKVRDEFLALPEREYKRLQGLLNHYALKEREEQEARERAAREEQRKAEEALRKAQEAAAQAKTEEERLAALLDAEEASQNAEEAATQLVLPTTKAAGLTTRVRWDFEVTDPFKLIAAKPDFFGWKSESEQFHVRRAEIIRSLNADENEATGLMPADGQNSITHAFGIRVFKDINTSPR